MVKETNTRSRKQTDRRSTPSVGKVQPVKPFASYQEAIRWLYGRTDYERQSYLRYNVTTFDLDRMRQLLDLVGNPHEKLNCVHVAGTKGKGSTATMLARMLEANNINVGLYTSPHVVHLNERIAVNGHMISEDQMLGLMQRIHAPVERLASKDRAPTFFEILTAMAFMHFADCQVDIAIIEAGMGGRLDSTNVIMPKVIGITNISLDHQHQLGSTLEVIAKEKAGVFKPGVPVVTVEQDHSVMKVLKAQAAAVKTSLLVLGQDIDFSYRFETSREHGPHNRICLTTPTTRFEHVRVPLHGQHQAINCGLALAILDCLKGCGYNIDTDKAAEGLQRVSLPGRMEMICEDPRVMIDGAHNAASIKALIHAVGQNIPYDSMIVIFGCNVDKDINGMLRQLQYGADKVIFTRSNSPKAADPEDLAERFSEISHKMCQTAPNLPEALQLARSAVGREDLILITGSFYLIGQAKVYLQPAQAAMAG